MLDQEKLLHKQLFLEVLEVADLKLALEELVQLVKEMMEEPEWLEVLSIVLQVEVVALEVLDQMEHRLVVEMVEQEPFPV